MIDVSAWTDVGLVRAHNEDAIALPGVVLAGRPPAPVRFRIETPPPGSSLVFAVADGMGGHAGGADASRLVALGLADGGAPTEEALHRLNDLLYDQMVRNPDLRGMGATVVAVEISASSARFFNVGDARGYAHVKGFSTLVTTEDRSAPGSNVITQSLGGAPVRTGISVHKADVPLERPTRLLLCSDGLSDYVALASIEDALDEPDVVVATRNLIAVALQAGGSDNVSVVVIDCDGEGHPGGADRSTPAAEEQAW